MKEKEKKKFKMHLRYTGGRNRIGKGAPRADWFSVMPKDPTCRAQGKDIMRARRIRGKKGWRSPGTRLRPLRPTRGRN